MTLMVSLMLTCDVPHVIAYPADIADNYNHGIAFINCCIQYFHLAIPDFPKHPEESCFVIGKEPWKFKLLI